MESFLRCASEILQTPCVNNIEIYAQTLMLSQTIRRLRFHIYLIYTYLSKRHLGHRFFPPLSTDQ